MRAKQLAIAAVCLAALAPAGCAARGATMTAAALTPASPAPGASPARPAPSGSPAASAAPGRSVGAIPNASVSPAIAGVVDDLRAALLTSTDLPAGYLPVDIASSGTGSVAVGGGGFPGCAALAPMTNEQTQAAAVSFSKGVMGPYVTNAVMRFPAGGAVAAMTRLASVPTACRSFDQQIAGLDVRFLVTTVPVPRLGEQTVGLRMTGTADFGIAVTAEIVAVRRGDLVVWLNDMTIGSTPAGLLDGLARTASARCAAVLRGC